MDDSSGKLAKALGALGLAYAGWKYADGKYNIAADLKWMKSAGPVVAKTIKLMKEPDASVVLMWYETLNRPGQAKKVFLIDAETDRQVTYGEIEALSNRVAHWALAKGFKPRSVVALYMDNRPEYLATWLGFAKVGIVCALINNNQRGKPFTHAVTVAQSTALIFGPEYAEVVADRADELRSQGVGSLVSFGLGSLAGAAKPACADESLDEHLEKLPSNAPDWKKLRQGIKVNDPVLYIYTSGTTGLPKACNISEARMFMFSMTMPMLQCTENDRIYGSGMPLYHTAANLGVMGAMRLGGSMILRTKFSASNHWKECGKYNATVMQYIGELCRYLLAPPESPVDKQHRVRLAVGNGLRPEIWDIFQRRFTVPEIGEFYGATEGNAATLNHCKNYEGQGAVGRAGSLMLKLRPMSILKFNVEEEIPIRDAKTGFCIECGPDEPGELVAPIKKIPGTDHDDFEGYTNKEATDKKILKDVFTKGDSYFRTGDLLRRDQKGYYYFVDRIGDTFRWKGENVSTMEVSEVLSSFPGIVDANVYGVQVPGKDGRACMVALTLQPEVKDIDAEKFGTYCRANLPGYSIPLFVRFIEENLSLTGTLKHQKGDYRNQGCDPSKFKDKTWWYNMDTKAFEPYGPEQFAAITAGRAKL
eukprot:TRINITY_DN74807_c0_g1_i1.p1 TRINITY_DN74807_c0_g1~~TRINITY_DN74807_c0_g1_i1.p1  ORF type:complete len:646 (-),score=201.07 TRINITY_DN74807_c0_g1_i1:144-2081(-)